MNVTENPMKSQQKNITCGILLFDNFELLDVYGPAEMLGKFPDQLELVMLGQKNHISSTQGPKTLVDATIENCPKLDWLLVPGGQGTRTEVYNQKILTFLQEQAKAVSMMISVCTGSALLAAAGLLDGHKATTNKRAFQWATGFGPQVDWQKQARWVEDGRFFTSSGVSAGIDMALAIIAKQFGKDQAQLIADATEYEWHQDASWDPFAKVHGLIQ